MRTLTITTCQAAIAEDCVALLADYFATVLDMPVRFVRALPWQQRASMFDRGAIDVAWICGTPYVRRADGATPLVTLLAAPVQAGQRYADRPIYFSDVVVRSDSPFEGFANLRGARWGYNEPGSHSGYFLFRSYLVQRGETTAFFGSVVETGAHQHSLAQIIAGEIDASAIDSTVLELALANDPALNEQIKVIATLGPSTSPPWVASQHLDPSLHERVRAALLAAHRHPAGRVALAAGQLARFAAVSDHHYDDIRAMAAQAALAGA